MTEYKPGDVVAVRGEVYFSGSGVLAVGLCPEGSERKAAVRLSTAAVMPWSDAERIGKLESLLRDVRSNVCTHYSPAGQSVMDSIDAALAQAVR